jgi:L,D-transpeptidase YbiS
MTEKKRRRTVLIVLAVLAVVLAGLEIAGRIVERGWRGGAAPTAASAAAKSPRDSAARVAQLEARMKSLAPWGLYVVIDTAANRLYLVRDQKVQKEVVVSCGSGDVLEERGGSRKWIFDTPRGEFSVTSKLVNPTWIKPDWAFIEEGEKPPANFNDRVDNDSLGAYALGFGDGYFIHGTLYTRLLGRNVTHGCVRVGDKDLKSVFETVPLGTKVYIY